MLHNPAYKQLRFCLHYEINIMQSLKNHHHNNNNVFMKDNAHPSIITDNTGFKINRRSTLKSSGSA